MHRCALAKVVHSIIRQATLKTFLIVKLSYNVFRNGLMHCSTCANVDLKLNVQQFLCFNHKKKLINQHAQCTVKYFSNSFWWSLSNLEEIFVLFFINTGILVLTSETQLGSLTNRMNKVGEGQGVGCVQIHGMCVQSSPYLLILLTRESKSASISS